LWGGRFVTPGNAKSGEAGSLRAQNGFG
jgi:hypothetical protein